MKIKNVLLCAAVFPLTAETVSAAPETTTLENLQAAFNGESNAKVTYENNFKTIVPRGRRRGYLLVGR